MDYLSTALLSLIGLYFVASGIGIARKPEITRQALQEMADSHTLTLLAGVVTFVIGATLVLVHNKWDSLPAGFVSFVGWSAMIKGLLLLAIPEALFKLANLLTPSTSITRLFGVVTFALGGTLLFIFAPVLLLFHAPV